MSAPVRAMQWTHPEAAAAIVAWGDGDIVYDAAVECQVGDPSWGDLRVESHWVNQPVPPGGWVVLGDDDEYRVRASFGWAINAEVSS